MIPKKYARYISMIVAGLLLFSCPGLHLPPFGANTPPVEASESLTMGDLEIGDRVVDNSWMWEHRTLMQYQARSTDKTKPVTWIVVAKDHFEVEGGHSHVTLLTEEVIAKHSFDDSSNRVHPDYGSNHWGDSGTSNAWFGLRPFLNSLDKSSGYGYRLDGFYAAFSESFKEAVLETTLINVTRLDEAGEWSSDNPWVFYNTQDKVFALSHTELGSEYSSDHQPAVGSPLAYFKVGGPHGPDGHGSALSQRRVAFNGGSQWDYWTRTPSTPTDYGHRVGLISSGGSLSGFNANDGNRGVRTAVNLSSDIRVIANEDGVYEIQARGPGEVEHFNADLSIPGNKYCIYNQELQQYVGLPFAVSISNAQGLGDPAELAGFDLNGDYSVVIFYDGIPVGGGEGAEGVTMFESGGATVTAVLNLAPGNYTLQVLVEGGDGENSPQINKTEEIAVNLVDFEDATSAISFNLTDTDVDKVYFPGDNLACKVNNLPHNVTDVKASFGVFTGPGDPDSFINAQVLDELSEQWVSGVPVYYITGQPTGGSVSFSGTVAGSLPEGTVGIEIFLTIELQELVGQPFSLPAIPLMETGKQAIVGVTIPDQFGDISAEPSLSQLANLYDTEQAVTFVKAGMGSITFEPGLNIMDTRAQLENLANFLEITYDEAENTLQAEVNTEALIFLSGQGAVIRFFGAMEKLGLDGSGLTSENFLEYINFAVFDNDGNPVSDLNDYFDLEAVSYNAETDTLLLPVYHFTRYLVGVKEQAPPVKYGDIDDNGSIDTGDVMLILQHVTGLSLLEGEALTRARVSGSTGPVDMGDAILILRHITGLNDEFPAEQR